MKKWVVTGLVVLVLVLALLGWTAPRWVPVILGFITENTDTIQGLTDAVQLVLWIGSAVLAGVSIWQRRKHQPPPVPGPSSTLSGRLTGSGGLAQGAGAMAVGAGGVAGQAFQAPVTVINTEKLEIGSVEALWKTLGQKQPPEDLTRATGRYLEHLVDRYRYIEFKGMGVTDRVALRLPLADLYIPLKARIETPEGDTWARDLRVAGRAPTEEEMTAMGMRLSEPRPILDLLQGTDGLVVLGDPGAGKSTFLKFLTLALAAGQGKGLGVGSRVPVLLPLSAYADAITEEDQALVPFIARYYQARGVELPLEPILREALERGGALLLFDGLDEVRDLSRRHLVVERVRDFFSFHRQAGNKFVLTSRIIGYREVRPEAEGLSECTLVDFDDEEIETFVGKWTVAVERAVRGTTPVAGFEAQREEAELLNSVHRNPGVRSLAANPLLLTILALMKRQGVALPERRVQLYQTYVETLLRNWQLARSLSGRSGRGLELVETLKILPPLALWMHENSPGVGLVKEGSLRRRLEEIFRDRGEENPEEAALRFLEEVRGDAGLLLDRGGRQYGFIHLTFQEYLAAVALARRGQQGGKAVAEVLAAHVGEPAWHEVILLTIGYLGVVQQWEEVAGEVVDELIRLAPGSPGEAVILAGRAVAEAGKGSLTPACRSKVTEALLVTMRASKVVEALRRAEAGKVLAELGDPRFDPDHWYLPKEPLLGFVQIPAGPFLMGSDRERDPKAFEDEGPLREVTLPTFYMGRFPVTVAQFQAFVEVSGYTSAAQDSLEGLSNHPVVRVSWHDASAYCQWLGGHLQESAARRVKNGNADYRVFWEAVAESRLIVSLPSEAEWEKAARGRDGLIYPWGDIADPNRANFNETQIGERSPVGCFSGGVSPWGCEEMSGNVWEWTRSLRETKKKKNPQKEDGLILDHWVCRGGCAIRPSSEVRSAFRVRNGSSFRNWYVGFRIALIPTY